MSGWQPIDTAPKDGAVILLCCNFRDGMQTMAGAWHTQRNEFHVFVGVRADALAAGDLPTYWMPLPEPPQESQ